ncbi:MAG: hypothetical protein AAGB02_02605 [Pseudomonadota bacterium]
MEAFRDDLMIGAGMIAFTVFVHSSFIASAGRILRPLGPGRTRLLHVIRDPLVLVFLSLWLLLAHWFSIGAWAWTMKQVGAVASMEDGMHVAANAYTTLGVSETLLSPDWFILGGIAAANGFFLFGLSTAYLFSVFTRFRIGV